MSYEVTLLVYCLTLFAAIGSWLLLAKMLFGRLSKHHAESFEGLGSPTLNDGGTDHDQNFRLSKFLLSCEFQVLNEESVSRICRVMRFLLFFIPIYFVGGFLVLLVQQ